MVVIHRESHVSASSAVVKHDAYGFREQARTSVVSVAALIDANAGNPLNRRIGADINRVHFYECADAAK